MAGGRVVRVVPFGDEAEGDREQGDGQGDQQVGEQHDGIPIRLVRLAGKEAACAG